VVEPHGGGASRGAGGGLVTLRFDHAVIAVGDLDAAVETYRRLGFDVQPGGRHTGKGTRNALIRFPAAYLELLAVDDRDEALAGGPSRVDLVRYLDETGGGGGFSTFALRTGGQPSELDALVARWRAAGIEVPGPNPAERRRPDGSVLRWRTAVPGGSSVRRTWPFVIEWPDGALPADPSALNHDNGAMRVTHVTVAGDAPALARAYEQLGLSRDLPGTAIRFADAAESGPLELGIGVEDLTGLAALMEERGVSTAIDERGALRPAAPDPATAFLAFIAASDEVAA
jgi:hypothetical protein